MPSVPPPMKAAEPSKKEQQHHHQQQKLKDSGPAPEVSLSSASSEEDASTGDHNNPALTKVCCEYGNQKRCVFDGLQHHCKEDFGCIQAPSAFR